ncbi:MAG: maleylpyruvate isomerase family mycothiol-dependent enzyme [Candidatus Nanopelagicales bacterium]
MVTPLGPDDTRPLLFADARASLRESTRALLATAETLSDDDCRAPSVLPGWSRGHVLTHLARNADGLGSLVTWARTGVETPMYASPEARTADIDSGAGRSAAALVADLRESSERLDEALGTLDAGALGVEMTLLSGASLEAAEIPVLRRREVEIHHVDLDVGYSPDDWPDDFVHLSMELLAPQARASRDVGVRELVDSGGWAWQVGHGTTDLHGPAGQLLAWLVGRGIGPGLHRTPPGPVPPSPTWV